MLVGLELGADEAVQLFFEGEALNDASRTLASLGELEGKVLACGEGNDPVRQSAVRMREQIRGDPCARFRRRAAGASA